MIKSKFAYQKQKQRSFLSQELITELDSQKSMTRRSKTKTETNIARDQRSRMRRRRQAATQYEPRPMQDRNQFGDLNCTTHYLISLWVI